MDWEEVHKDLLRLCERPNETFTPLLRKNRGLTKRNLLRVSENFNTQKDPVGTFRVLTSTVDRKYNFLRRHNIWTTRTGSLSITINFLS